jgi:predicted TIM-barrel fold metal-dependent hydrolase
MSLDVHAHFYPPAYISFLTRLGGHSAHLADRIQSDLRSPFIAGKLDERVQNMVALGIDCQVLSIPNQWVLVEDAARCVEHVVSANDALAEVCTLYPRQFRLFASLPLVDPEAAVRELQRVRQQLRADGVIVPTNVVGHPLDWSGMEPVYAEIERQQMVLFLHPAPPPYAATPDGYDDYGLGPALYYPVEDSRALLRMIFSGVFERYPALRVICPHLGGVIPFLWERIARQTRSRLERSGLRPVEEYLQRVLFDTVTEDTPALECALRYLGPERLVLGTDFPQGPKMESILSCLAALKLDETVRQSILSTNVSRWLPSVN